VEQCAPVCSVCCDQGLNWPGTYGNAVTGPRNSALQSPRDLTSTYHSGTHVPGLAKVHPVSVPMFSLLLWNSIHLYIQLSWLVLLAVSWALPGCFLGFDNWGVELRAGVRSRVSDRGEVWGAGVPLWLCLWVTILGLYTRKKNKKGTAPFSHILLWVYRENHENMKKTKQAADV